MTKAPKMIALGYVEDGFAWGQLLEGVRARRPMLNNPLGRVASIEGTDGVVRYWISGMAAGSEPAFVSPDLSEVVINALRYFYTTDFYEFQGA